MFVATVETRFEAKNILHIKAVGRWVVWSIKEADRTLRLLKTQNATKAVLDLSAVESMDTTGGLVIERTLQSLQKHGISVQCTGGNKDVRALIKQVSQYPIEDVQPPKKLGFCCYTLNRIGKAAFELSIQCKELLSFFGEIAVVFWGAIRHPRKFRLISLTHHIEDVGMDALPIVGLISFLIGVVLAYQGVHQLARFGAEIFTINLLGISILREVGVLITSIVVAGRSGSAFTAQVGTMVLNEEVNAMKTMGLDPMEYLVVPRILGLVIALPFLTFFADILGLIGGSVMLSFLIDISFGQIIDQVRQAVTLKTFFIGLVKAPVFAFLIAMVGCFEGLKVTGSAESVGQQTTRSVVEGIFLVIIFDALFSVVFSHIGW